MGGREDEAYVQSLAAKSHSWNLDMGLLHSQDIHN